MQKILLVDDELMVLRSLNRLLRDHYQVFYSTDPAQALAICEQEDIVLVISDQRMPIMTGSELLANIKLKHPQMETVLLTGYSDMDAAIAAINDGDIRQYIQKPWDNQELLRLLQAILAAHPGQAQNHAQTDSQPHTRPHSQTDTPAQASRAVQVLLLDDRPSGLLQLASEQGWTLRWCQSLDQAAELLQQGWRADVLLFAGNVPNDELLPSLLLLQQLQPSMRSIVLRQDCNDTLLVRLLNQGQIYRFYRKPTNESLLAKAIQAAPGRQKAYLQGLPPPQWQAVEKPIWARLKQLFGAAGATR